LLAALREEFGSDLPVYWGNRNWHPFLGETLATMAADGVTGAYAFLTSAYNSYSGCRQYREDLARARAAVGPDAPTLTRLRQFHNHPGFVEPMADRVREAVAGFPPSRREAIRIVFVAHSLPASQAAASGPAGGTYEHQLEDAARLVVERLDRSPGWQLAYCSRSGPRSVPWLEPDVLDCLDVLAAEGAKDVVLAPIGFLSDHLEVAYDLDVEAAGRAARLGLGLRRARTVGDDPAFVAMVKELVDEQLDPDRPRRALGTDGPGHTVCPAGCCLPAGQEELPAVSGATGGRQG
jgi:ferrochelatase